MHKSTKIELLAAFHYFHYVLGFDKSASLKMILKRFEGMSLNTYESAKKEIEGLISANEEKFKAKNGKDLTAKDRDELILSIKQKKGLK